MREKEISDGNNNTQAGKWTLVGGRIESDESYMDGLMREVYEECGLRINVGRVMAVQEWWPEPRGEQWHVVAIFFTCTVSDENQDVILSDEHDDYQWIDPVEYKEIGLVPNLHPVFEQYLNL